jgi:hypothetical protein
VASVGWDAAEPDTAVVACRLPLRALGHRVYQLRRHPLKLEAMMIAQAVHRIAAQRRPLEMRTLPAGRQR